MYRLEVTVRQVHENYYYKLNFSRSDSLTGSGTRTTDGGYSAFYFSKTRNICL